MKSKLFKIKINTTVKTKRNFYVENYLSIIVKVYTQDQIVQDIVFAIWLSKSDYI